MFFGFTTAESRTKIFLPVKLFYPPPPTPVASAADRSKAVVLLLLIYCLLMLTLFVGVCVKSLFCYAVLCVCSLVLQSSSWERERAGCFSFIFLLSCEYRHLCSVSLPLPSVGRSVIILWYFLVSYKLILMSWKTCCL